MCLPQPGLIRLILAARFVPLQEFFPFDPQKTHSQVLSYWTGLLDDSPI
jgi:hypothetical protein